MEPRGFLFRLISEKQKNRLTIWEDLTMIKFNKKILAFAGIAALTVGCLTGCGGSADLSYSMKAEAPAMEYSMNDSYAPESYYGYEEYENSYDTSYTSASAAETGEQAAEQTNASSERKLIKNVYLNIETLEFDAACRTIEENINAIGGYIESSSVYSDSYSYYNDSYRKNRDASYVLRVPREKLDSFVNAIGNIGTITNQSSNTEDVTLSYLDVEARAKSLKLQQEKLFELLEKAEYIEDIIALEERISEVTYQLEAQESMLKNYDNLVSFSTVTLNLSEVKRVTVAEPETVGERIAAGLDDTFYDIKEGFKDFAVDFVVNLPFIIIWLAVLAIIVLVIVLIAKLCKKGRNKRLAKKQAKWAAQRDAAQKQQDTAQNNVTEQK